MLEVLYCICTKLPSFCSIIVLKNIPLKQIKCIFMIMCVCLSYRKTWAQQNDGVAYQVTFTGIILALCPLRVKSLWDTIFVFIILHFPNCRCTKWLWDVLLYLFVYSFFRYWTFLLSLTLSSFTAESSLGSRSTSFKTLFPSFTLPEGR